MIARPDPVYVLQSLSIYKTYHSKPDYGKYYFRFRKQASV